MSKKRILIVSSEFPPQPGGIGNHTFNLAKYLYNHNYDVTVIADIRSEGGFEESVFDASQSFKIKRIKNQKPRILMYFERLRLLFDFLKQSDLIVATGKFSLWSVGFGSLFYNRFYLAVVHGTEVNFNGWLLKKSIELSLLRFAKVIAVSDFTKSLIVHLSIDIHVIPNGIDIDQWKPVATSAKAKLKGFPKLVTVGNVTSRKGQQNVIKALPKLVEQFPNLHYHCVGLNTEKSDFYALAKTLDVASHVTFHGRVAHTGLKAIIEDSDIFVMLSSNTITGDVEGFGIAILEANALGVPSIGAQGCGIENAINNGRSGLLIDGQSDEEFLKAIKLINSEREMFKKGALSWAAQHKWEDLVLKYIEVMT